MKQWSALFSNSSSLYPCPRRFLGKLDWKLEIVIGARHVLPRATDDREKPTAINKIIKSRRGSVITDIRLFAMAEHTNSSGVVPLNVEGKNISILIQQQINKPFTSSPVPEASASQTNPKIRSCCETIIDDKRLCDVIREKLKGFYKKLRLPSVSWLEERNYLLTIDEYFIELQLSDSKKEIKIKEIFKSSANEQLLRILIEGQPGFGKTALATKLVYDWACNEEYISNHFQLVFFMPLRDLKSRSIKDKILMTAKLCGCDESDDIMRIVDAHKERTLLILDGFDEISQEEREEIMTILFKQMYSQITVAVFCRTGLFALSKDERSRFVGPQNMKLDFYDKRISILGVLSIERKCKFLEKFMKKEIVDDIMTRLSPQWDLFDSPLFLMLLTIIIQGGGNIEDFSTKAVFYKKLFNSILKHSLVKRDEIDGDYFDLFSFNSAPNDIQNKMKEFGMLSAKKIIENNLQFESNNLTKEIYGLGFLIHHKADNPKEVKIQSSSHYEALHLSIIEFSAAYAFLVAMKFSRSMSTSTEKLFKSIINHFFETEGTSLILPFLSSLMGEDLDHLLSRIDSFSAWFSLDLKSTVELLTECTSIKLSSRQFVSSNEVRNYERKLQELIQYGNDCCKIEEIIIDEETESGIFRKRISSGSKIQFHIKSSGSDLGLNVPCKMTQVFSYPVTFHESFEKCLDFVALSTSNSSSEKCLVKFLSSSRIGAECLQLIDREEAVFSKIKYRYLQIEIRTEHEYQVLTKLLKNNCVEILDLSVIDQNVDTSYFSIAAGQSSFLTGLSLYNITIDLYDLTKGGRKKYAYMSIYNCIFTCRQPLLRRNCCEDVKINNLQNIEALIEMEPLKLNCGLVDIINDLIEKYPEWKGFKTVQSLSLTDPDDILLNSENVWKNLKTLELKFNERPNGEKLAMYIQKLPIVNLVIENYFSLDISSLFKHMNKLWADQNISQLKNIVLNDYNKSLSEVFELIEGLEHKRWDKVDLVATKIELRKLREYFMNFNVQLTYANYESNYLELDRFLSYFETYLPGHHHGLSITRS
uniref:NACHT domain-containing protein n=1 Tax=Strigamia maritima TaxID=126957 RepID=T1J9B7_STRMM